MTEAPRPGRTIRRLTLTLAVLVPVIALILSRLFVGPAYQPSSAFGALSVIHAVVLFGAGIVASLDYAGAHARERGIELTRASLILAGVVLVSIMLLGSVTLEQAIAEGDPGASTNAVAVVFIPAYAFGGALITYCLVWLVGSAVSRARA
jgi:hypothetical protein